MKQPRINKVLKDSRAQKGTRKRSKEIEEIQKMLEGAELEAYGLAEDCLEQTGIALDIAALYRRLAIAGWLVALTLSGAFIWQNLDLITNLLK